MARINSHKIQQSRQLQLCVTPTAQYDLSVCICVPTSDTHTLEKIRKVMSYFSKSFVVFVGEENTPIEHAIYLPIHNPSEAQSRTLYVSFVLAHRSAFDLMIVIDPALSLHKEIPCSSFSCCNPERLSKWDAVFANQSYKYYDTVSFVSSSGEPMTKRHIPSYVDPIPVLSAFGGLAIYKTQYLSTNMYNCAEYISFNRGYLNNGGVRMFLEPSLVLETPPQNAHLYV